MLPVLNFDKQGTAIVHGIIADAALALGRCAICCKARDNRFKAAFQQWFMAEPDESNEPSMKLLTWSVEQMRDRLEERGDKLVVMRCDEEDIMKGDFGNVNSFAHRLERTESRPVRDAVDSYYGNGQVATIRLSSEVLGLERTSQYGVTQLVVFLHELSHWAAGTRDLKHGSKAELSKDEIPQRCYGSSSGGAAAVARGKYADGTMRAVQNADSVAYFVSSFLLRSR